MNKAEELREHVLVKESENKAIEDFIRKIWKIFPENRTTSVESSLAMIMRGSMDPDEVIQALENYFETAEELLVEKNKRDFEAEEANEEAEKLKESLKENMEVFSKEITECREKNLEDMKMVIDEHFDYIQEQITKTENNINDGE